MGKVLRLPSEKSNFCYRHPVSRARRKCFFCERHICKKCQVRELNHIFCGSECLSRYRRKKRAETLKAILIKPIGGFYLRLILYLSLSFIILSTMFGIRFIDIFYSSGTMPNEIMHKKKPAAQKSPDWNAPGQVIITEPVDETLVHSEFQIKGSAPAHSMVGLYINGRNIVATLSKDGTFLFDKINLPLARNTIQARYFGVEGEDGYSKAINLYTNKPTPMPLSVVHVATPAHRSPLDFSRGNLSYKEILLTFDGGSNANSADEILAILSKYHLHAAIFLTGEFIRKYPDIVKRIIAEGHVIGNHSLSHPHLTTYSFNQRHDTLPGVTNAYIKSQLDQTNDLYLSVAGKPISPYWRAPFGEFNHEILSWAKDDGYSHIAWTPFLDTLDWVADKSLPYFRSPNEIISRIMKTESMKKDGLNGGIILMHLGTEREGGERLDNMLEPLILRLQERGYNFVSLPTLINDANPLPSNK